MAEQTVVGQRHLRFVHDEVLVRLADRLLLIPAAEERQRAPALGVDHIGAAIGFLDVVADLERTAVLLGVLIAKLHVALVQHVVGRGTQQRHVHTHLGGDQQCGVGHGGVQRLGVIRPGEHVLLVLQIAQVLLQRHRMGQLLARMGDGLHVDHWHRRVLGKRLDHVVLAIHRPILELREGAHRNQVDVARQHARHFGNVLFGIAVHHRAHFELDRPCVLARRQHNGMATQMEGA